MTTSLNAEAVNLSPCRSFLFPDTTHQARARQFLVVKFSSFETTRRQNEFDVWVPVVAMKNREVL